MLFVTDYHETLSLDSGAGEWKYLGWHAVADRVKRRDASSAAAFLCAAPKMYGLFHSYRNGWVDYNHVCDALNRRVLSRMPVKEVKRYLQEYSVHPKTQSNLRSAVLEAVKAVRGSGADCFVISKGCNFTINETLKEYWPGLFRGIAANSIERDGSGSRFESAISGPEERRRELLGVMNLTRSRSITYAGNSFEELPCMKEVLRGGGRVIIAPASEDEVYETLRGIERVSQPATDEQFAVEILKSASLI